jgi:hypothetical protein|tara:strand:- start:106 stop:582 length:477 start_codon:yes stop_codon:yes gene_type:complete
MSDFELENKSEMVYIPKNTIIVKQDTVTCDLNNTIVKVDENNNEINPEQIKQQIETEKQKWTIFCEEVEILKKRFQEEINQQQIECDTDEHKNSDNKFISCDKIQHITHMFIIMVGYIYFFYCVWNIQNTQHNICYTLSTNVIYNDVYSGVNYHTIHN